MNNLKNIFIFITPLLLISLYFVSFAQIHTDNIPTSEDSSTKESNDYLKERESSKSSDENIIQKSGEDKEDVNNFDFIKIPDKIFENPFSGVVQIKGEVSRGDRVEFFIKGEIEGTDIYLGSSPVENNRFSFELNSESIPNGSYSLIVKIIISNRNVYSKIFPIKIFNSPQPPPQEVVTEIEKVKQEVEKTQELLEPKKEEVKEIIEKVDPSLAKNEAVLNNTLNVLTSEKEAVLKDKELNITEKEKEKIKRLINKIDEEVKVLEKAEKESKVVNPKIINKLKEEKTFIKKDLEKKLFEIDETFDKKREELKELKQKIDTKKAELLESIGDENKRKVIENKLEQKKKEIEEKAEEFLEKRRVLVADDDGDGLPNEFEVRIGTNPKAADSDNDGIIDAAEYVNGLNPLKPSPKARIVYKDPRKVKPKNPEIFKVASIKIEKSEKTKEGKELVIRGKALPNSFVTVYIYSPIILLAKADSEGNWEVRVDREVEDGDHEVYVALTDNEGDILARSEPFAFKKVKDDIIVIDANALAASFVSPSKQVESRFLLLTIISVLIGLGIVFIILGLKTKRT